MKKNILLSLLSLIITFSFVENTQAMNNNRVNQNHHQELTIYLKQWAQITSKLSPHQKSQAIEILSTQIKNYEKHMKQANQKQQSNDPQPDYNEIKYKLQIDTMKRNILLSQVSNQLNIPLLPPPPTQNMPIELVQQNQLPQPQPKKTFFIEKQLKIDKERLETSWNPYNDQGYARKQLVLNQQMQRQFNESSAPDSHLMNQVRFDTTNGFITIPDPREANQNYDDGVIIIPDSPITPKAIQRNTTIINYSPVKVSIQNFFNIPEEKTISQPKTKKRKRNIEEEEEMDANLKETQPARKKRKVKDQINIEYPQHLLEQAQRHLQLQKQLPIRMQVQQVQNMQRMLNQNQNNIKKK